MSNHADTIIQKQYRKGFLSMRDYVRPMMMSEAFAPNEYIAACYTLVCAIPGSSATEIGDGTATRYFNGADGFGRYRYTMWDGNRVYADGLAHEFPVEFVRCHGGRVYVPAVRIMPAQTFPGLEDVPYLAFQDAD